MAAAGSKAKLQIWNVGANSNVRKALASKLSEAGRTLKEKASGTDTVGVASDDEDDSGDED